MLLERAGRVGCVARWVTPVVGLLCTAVALFIVAWTRQLQRTWARLAGVCGTCQFGEPAFENAALATVVGRSIASP